MRVWRLCKARHADTAFSGEGTMRVPFRWTPKGVRAVYAASTLSLALLENLVHMQPQHFSFAYVAFPVDIPDSVEIQALDPAALPADWCDPEAPPALRRIGADWLAAGRTAVLAAPSAVVSTEENFLLNPAHPAFGEILIGPSRPFRFDPRLLQR